MGLAVVNLYPKAVILYEITCNDGQRAFTVNQSHRFLYRSKARMRLTIAE